MYFLRLHNRVWNLLKGFRNYGVFKSDNVSLFCYLRFYPEFERNIIRCKHNDDPNAYI